MLAPYIANHKKEEKKREFINAVFLRNPLYRRGINKAYKVYAANKETQLALQKNMKHPERCELLTENGVSENFINNLIPRMKYNPDGEVVLLWAGRMVYRKGLEFLLDVIDMVDSNRKWCLKLVGDGNEKEVLINKCKTIKNGDKVHFIGKVSYDEMRELYASSDMFVFPSLRETTGSVIFEAMANQIPVISFMQNGVSLIVDEETGILVPLTDDLDEVKMNFCRAIENLIENDSLRMQMGVNAKNKILNNYLWSEKVKKIKYCDE